MKHILDNFNFHEKTGGLYTVEISLTLVQILQVTKQKNFKKDEFGADELLPIIEFVLIRGAIQNLGIEIQFIKDFLHPDIQGGQKGLWFCHFLCAYKSLSKV